MKLSLPPDSVFKLPLGAFFTARRGQVSLRVGRDKDGRLTAESECDSISRRCYYLEEEVSRLSRQSSGSLSETVTVQPPKGPTGLQWFWIRTGQLLAALLAVRVIARRSKFNV